MVQPIIPMGKELEQVISEMGLTRNGFAKLVGVTEPTVANWIKNPYVVPKAELAWKAKVVLDRRCRICGQHTEKQSAWNHKKTREEGGGNRKEG